MSGTIGPAGTGLIGYPHPSIANLWVREIDPTTTATYPFLIITGVIKNVADVDIDNDFATTLTYAHGCVLTQVDGTTNLSAQWENVGSAATPVWERWSIT
jgi:hypothetical protein